MQSAEEPRTTSRGTTIMPGGRISRRLTTIAAVSASLLLFSTPSPVFADGGDHPAESGEVSHANQDEDIVAQRSAIPAPIPSVDLEPASPENNITYDITSEQKPSGERMLINIADQSAPTKYSFVVTGADLIIRLDDGSLALLDVLSGDQVSLVGRIAAPWAHDATGASVPTYFTVSGDVVTQVVEHTSAQYSYGITADPDLTKCAAGALAGLLPGAGAAAAAGSIIPFWGTIAGGVVGALYGAGTGCVLAGG